MTDTHRATGEELRQFVQQYEAMEAERQEISACQRDKLAEVKAAGYDTKVFRRVIAERKKTPDQIAEEEAVLDMYRNALGMA